MLCEEQRLEEPQVAVADVHLPSTNANFELAMREGDADVLRLQHVPQDEPQTPVISVGGHSQREQEFRAGDRKESRTRASADRVIQAAERAAPERDSDVDQEALHQHEVSWRRQVEVSKGDSTQRRQHRTAFGCRVQEAAGLLCGDLTPSHDAGRKDVGRSDLLRISREEVFEQPARLFRAVTVGGGSGESGCRRLRGKGEPRELDRAAEDLRGRG